MAESTGGRQERPLFELVRQEDGSYAFYFSPPRLPEEFGEHTRNARRETLLAIRSLLDAAIDVQEPRGRRSARPRNIEVK